MKKSTLSMNVFCRCSTFTFLVLNHFIYLTDGFLSPLYQQHIEVPHLALITKFTSSKNRARSLPNAKLCEGDSLTKHQMKNLEESVDITVTSSSIDTTDETLASTILSPKNLNLDKQSISAAEYALGIIVLLTVPCAWGTFAPVVRYVYEMEIPFPGFLFSAGYYTIASLTLNLILFVQHFLQKDNNMNDENTTASREISSPWERMPITGGFELGGYLFIGNCLQVVGLETVSADRAAFLVQLTTVFVPLLQAFFYLLEDNYNHIKKNIFEIIPVQTWIACILAFFGVIVMGFDDGSTSLSEISITQNENGNLWEFTSHSLSSFSSLGIGVGDLLVLAAAVSYTFHVVRLSKYAQDTTPLKLACSKATFEAIFSVFLVLVLANSASFTTIPSITSMGQEITRFLDAYGSGGIPLPAIFACLWTGWVTCAYTIYAQSFGQKRIRNPTYANLIYSTQPLFSAGFAWLLLGEKLGLWGFVGGGLIGIALTLITLSEQQSRDGVKELIEPLP